MTDTDQTLRDVLARLDALEQRNAALEQQNAALLTRDEWQPIATDTTNEDDGSPLERMSRRWVLRRGMQAAAATVAAGVLLRHETNDARAVHFDNFIEVDWIGTHNILLKDDPTLNNAAVDAQTTHATRPAVLGKNTGAGPGVKGTNAGVGPAIEGVASGENGVGVKGAGYIGVHGVSGATGYGAVYGQHIGQAGYGVIGDGKGADHAGVLGRNPAGWGVMGDGLIGVKGMSSAPGYGASYGVHTNGGHGVVGDGNGASSAGVLGRNAGGDGVRGEGKAGVVGRSSFAGWEGVYGEHTGTGEGYGVVGDARGSSGAGLLGRHAAATGVRGEGKTGVHGKATSGNGVFGESGSGYGAVVSGGRAQLRLVPRATVGKPTTGSHQVGELYLDKVGTLFICTVAGTPGTWKKVTVS